MLFVRMRDEITWRVLISDEVYVVFRPTRLALDVISSNTLRACSQE